MLLMIIHTILYPKHLLVVTIMFSKIIYLIYCLSKRICMSSSGWLCLILLHQFFYEWNAAWCCEQVRCTRNCIMCDNRVKVDYYKQLLAVMRNLRIVQNSKRGDLRKKDRNRKKI